jgi:gamma-tubulin complex component 2
MGSPRSREIVSRLLASGCAPYFSILDKWVHEGVLDDPHEEFMVKVINTILISLPT